jgi:hypothetical protein
MMGLEMPGIFQQAKLKQSYNKSLFLSHAILLTSIAWLAIVHYQPLPIVK